MASKTLTAQLLSIPEQLLFPLYKTLKGLPVYLLFPLLVAFLGIVFLAVSYSRPHPALQDHPYSCIWSATLASSYFQLIYLC